MLNHPKIARVLRLIFDDIFTALLSVLCLRSTLHWRIPLLWHYIFAQHFPTHAYFAATIVEILCASQKYTLLFLFLEYIERNFYPQCSGLSKREFQRLLKDENDLFMCHYKMKKETTGGNN